MIGAAAAGTAIAKAARPPGADNQTTAIAPIATIAVRPTRKGHGPAESIRSRIKCQPQYAPAPVDEGKVQPLIIARVIRICRSGAAARSRQSMPGMRSNGLSLRGWRGWRGWWRTQADCSRSASSTIAARKSGRRRTSERHTASIPIRVAAAKSANMTVNKSPGGLPSQARVSMRDRWPRSSLTD